MEAGARAVGGRRWAALVVIGVVLLTGCTQGGAQGRAARSGAAPAASAAPGASTPTAPTGTPGAATETPGAATETPGAATETPGGASAEPSPSAASAGPPPTRGPVRLERWFDRDLSGGRLRLGSLREQTSSYRSYNMSYRSEDLRISGVIDVPRGRGPFPAVVLAHGYIDPARYVRGQGMPRERRYLAAAGYIALHVDYRNHAASDDDPAWQRTARLGYSVDVLNAVNALRATDEVPVDDERIALMGRSMGGGVVMRALEMAPGQVAAAVVYASVSSDEADNYEQFHGPSAYWDYVDRRWGSPDDNPRFWTGISADQHFDRITEPVLMHHGTVDTTCPPRWARHTSREMDRAGVDVTLRWYEGEGHTFEAAFDRSMQRSVAFLERHLG